VLATRILRHIVTELSKSDETENAPGKPRRIVSQHIVNIYCYYRENDNNIGHIKITIIIMKSTIDENLACGTV
jgi:hypothetical protein